MSKDEINELSTLLDQWLEYGDLKELADKYLKGKYRYEYASKVKNARIRNTCFMVHLIERAIYRKNLIQSSTQRLRA